MGNLIVMDFGNFRVMNVQEYMNNIQERSVGRLKSIIVKGE